MGSHYCLQILQHSRLGQWRALGEPSSSMATMLLAQRGEWQGAGLLAQRGEWQGARLLTQRCWRGQRQGGAVRDLGGGVRQEML